MRRLQWAAFVCRKRMRFPSLGYFLPFVEYSVVDGLSGVISIDIDPISILQLPTHHAYVTGLAD